MHYMYNIMDTPRALKCLRGSFKKYITCKAANKYIWYLYCKTRNFHGQFTFAIFASKSFSWKFLAWKLYFRYYNTCKEQKNVNYNCFIHVWYVKLANLNGREHILFYSMWLIDVKLFSIMICVWTVYNCIVVAQTVINR